MCVVALLHSSVFLGSVACFAVRMTAGDCCCLRLPRVRNACVCDIANQKATCLLACVQVQARIVEVQRQLHDMEATLEMNPGHEMSEDEARLVQQLENLKVEFGEMLYELRHKLSAAGKVTAGRPRADYSATPTQAQRPHRVRRHRRREYWTAGVRVGPQRQYRQ